MEESSARVLFHAEYSDTHQRTGSATGVTALISNDDGSRPNECRPLQPRPHAFVLRVPTCDTQSLCGSRSRDKFVPSTRDGQIGA